MADRPTPPPLDPAVRAYYERRPEETRLQNGASRMEGARTRELVERLAPPPPGRVLDVGGAAGVYAFWLAERGYTVHLVDPVERLVRLAEEANEGRPRGLASVRVGDARDLPFDDGSADIVLLLGPMYHLPERADRLRALGEARRVLRSEGLLFAACITRWASLMDGVAFDYLADPVFAALVEEDLRTGVHRNPEGKPGYFTTSFFHRPEEFRTEIEEAGFEVQGVYGLEGPTRMLTDFDERWADPRRREDMLRVARETELEPSLLGINPHLLGVGRAP